MVFPTSELPKVLDELHAEVERLLPSPGQKPRRMLAHALIELGKELRCGMETCVCASRDFFEVAGPRRLSTDHIIPIVEGGSHRPDNLQFAHLCCNVGMGLGMRSTEPKYVWKRLEEMASLERTLVVEARSTEVGAVPMPGSDAGAFLWRIENGRAIRGGPA